MADACTHHFDTGFVALGYAKVALLGVVQGITELLPISSTAHMRVVPALLGWQDPGSGFSAAMQLAALTAVVSYFWSDVHELASYSWRALARQDFKDRHFRFVVWIVLATIPIGIAGLALAGTLNACSSPLRSLSVIGWACIAMAILLGIAEVCARHNRTIDNVSIIDAVIVGIAQVGALIPGVSRSGSTPTAALALGFKRDEAARFSFLLGLPAIVLAGLKELWEIHKVDLNAHGWSILIVGLVVASVSAFVAIWGLVRHRAPATGKMRVSSGTWGGERVVSGDPVLEVRTVGASCMLQGRSAGRTSGSARSSRITLTGRVIENIADEVLERVAAVRRRVALQNATRHPIEATRRQVTLKPLHLSVTRYTC